MGLLVDKAQKHKDRILADEAFNAKDMWTSQSKSSLTTDSHLTGLIWWGPVTNFFFFVEITYRQLRVCYYMELSLTTGRIYILQLMLGLANAVPFRVRALSVS